MRLRNKPDTHFVSYDEHAGVWKFRVDHFTRYGVDPQDEDYVNENVQMDMNSPQHVLVEQEVLMEEKVVVVE